MWLVPPERWLVVRVAVSGWVPDKGAVPRTVDPLVNSTVPVGVPPGGDVVTVAVR